MADLPQHLQTAVSDAKQALVAHPQHTLSPFPRQNIYNALMLRDSQNVTRVYLSIISVKHVMHIWESQLPSNDWAMKNLQLAEDVFYRRTDYSKEELLAKPTGFIEQVAERKIYTSQDNASDKTDAIALASADLLHQSVGIFMFDLMEIDEQTTNSDIDPWHADAAAWCAYAVTGGEWNEQSDKAKRFQFWSWWLDEAVPQAYNAFAHAL